jgi:preprotein translocase subunit YajC
MIDFFISAAQAADAAQPSTEQNMISILMLVVLFGVFYFLLIRPQQKRVKEHKNMTDALKKGDEIVTFGGVLGRITDIGDAFVDVEIASNIIVKVQKQSIASVMPKGTMSDA